MNDQLRSALASGKVASVPMTPRVSVVMVVYRTGEPLAESIRRVLDDPLVDEFVIVDNGSPAKDAEMLRRVGMTEPRVILIQGQGNVGFAKGANMGARAARGRFLVFLNPDAFLQPGCIDALVQALAGQPRPTIAGACVLNPDGTEQRGARRGEVTPVTTILSFSRLSRQVPGLRQFEIHREDAPMPTAVTPIPTISGACFSVTRADFDALNGFDERFFLHVEDVDLCWRARQRGGDVVFTPRARVVHLGHTSQTDPLAVEFHKGMGLAKYFIKRADNLRRRVFAVSVAPLVVFTAILRPLLWKITGRPI